MHRKDHRCYAAGTLLDGCTAAGGTRRTLARMATDTAAALNVQLAEDAAGRFLRYVRIDTQSEEDSEEVSEHLRSSSTFSACCSGSSRSSGSPDAAIDEHGYVTATLPPTVDRRGADDRVLRARRHGPRGERREREAHSGEALRRAARSLSASPARRSCWRSRRSSARTMSATS